jgi:hypothetical protein
MRSNVSPVKYELGSYIPEGGILHSHRRENLKSDMLKAFVRHHFVSVRTCHWMLDVITPVRWGTRGSEPFF